MRIERGLDPEQIRQSAKHTLFVEGSEDSIDYQVLDLLLQDTGVTIRPIGHSHNVRLVAQALRVHHPNYYFLKDRDHDTQEVVERSWKKFPDADTDNLLIWRRREIENYFLIPEYLEKSRFCSCSPNRLRTHIAEIAKKRVFFDVANLVILELKQKLKQEWIEIFNSLGDDFDTKEKAVQHLLQKRNLAKQSCSIVTNLDIYPVENRFYEMTQDFLKDQETCQFSHGCWLEMIKGKHIFLEVVDKCFRVKDRTGKFLQGQERVTEVVKDLVRLPFEDQPDDFKELHALIENRIRKI